MVILSMYDTYIHCIFNIITKTYTYDYTSILSEYLFR